MRVIPRNCGFVSPLGVNFFVIISPTLAPKRKAQWKTQTNSGAALIAAFEHLKAQDALIFALSSDLAALRGALLENRPERIVRFEEILASELTTSAKSIADSQRVFDETILQLRESDARWVN